VRGYSTRELEKWKRLSRDYRKRVKRLAGRDRECARERKVVRDCCFERTRERKKERGREGLEKGKE